MSNAVIWMGGEGIEGIPVVCRHSTPQVGLFSFYPASGNKMREPMGIHSNAVAAPPQLLLERLKDYGQEDAFALWDELSPEERHLLLNDIQSLDLSRIDRIIRSSLRSQGLPVAAIEPVPESWVSSVDERTMEHRERWWKMGLKAISEGKLAVLLLSGGQVLLPVELYSMSLVGKEWREGKRGLGLEVQIPRDVSMIRFWKSTDCDDYTIVHWLYIGLPSGKSLFQLQAERILCVQRLAAQAMNEGSVTIHWYIMTSPFTDDATGKFFESHKYFGLEADQVTFFQQGTIPCISKDGRYVMETPFKVAKSPDGNGGVYTALKSSRLLEDMATRGIKYVDCYGVDNALVRVADPTFLGYFIDKGVTAAAKVVRKNTDCVRHANALSFCCAYPQEKVGVFVRRGKGGPLTVVEYTELDQSLASAVNQQTGRLRFCWRNVLATYMPCANLPRLCYRLCHNISNIWNRCDYIPCANYFMFFSYHLAETKIPSIHGYTMGLKLEQFIFDAFPYAPSTALFEILREEEFAPVKNANGSNYDTPDSARLLVLRLHTRWVVAAGGFLTHSVPLYATGNFTVDFACSVMALLLVLDI
ncbi:UDP-N-acetylglucosamine diphosphorylase 2-like [Gossypium australe]|uniref:UDP-N-acetylglucosamine diphosphorylase n=1 Tax=Gossypium australe TaxID=47621 RepID=A0A5B6WLJ3_9ROSI|nr:UDP-N-acetylglucosamine diphosphorylase 2-like [Gossypium australe]